MKLYEMIVRGEAFEKIKRTSEVVKNINEKDANGMTALLLAIQRGNASIVDVLIENGADVNVTNDKGIPALILAKRTGNKMIASLLVKAGATAKGNE